MKCRARFSCFAVLIMVAVAVSPGVRDATAKSATSPADPLPSWNEGASKKSIFDFVKRATTPGSPDFVAQEERIATFDNDGTLWSEQPMYVELAFIFARVKALAPKHPEWKTTQPFQGVLQQDSKAIGESGEKGLMELFGATHSGMTTEEFEKTVSDWIVTARHLKFNRPYTECIY